MKDFKIKLHDMIHMSEKCKFIMEQLEVMNFILEMIKSLKKNYLSQFYLMNQISRYR